LLGQHRMLSWSHGKSLQACSCQHLSVQLASTHTVTPLLWPLC
jgi:hypothetical protein